MKTIYHSTAGCILIREPLIKVNQVELDVLLIFREYSSTDKGWFLAKGHIENGETPEQTALRETIEETGYSNIELIRFIEKMSIEYEWKPTNTLNKKEIYWYLAKIITPRKRKQKLTPDEMTTIKKRQWFPLSRAIKLVKNDNIREMLAKI